MRMSCLTVLDVVPTDVRDHSRTNIEHDAETSKLLSLGKKTMVSGKIPYYTAKD